ncbi:MAG: DUF4339 domain-containing protein [Pirellula sp.]
MIDEGWFYTLGDGKTLGPITRNELLRKIRSGQIVSNQLAWHESLSDWQAISSIPELSVASPSHPPPPPSVCFGSPASGIYCLIANDV